MDMPAQDISYAFFGFQPLPEETKNTVEEPMSNSMGAFSNIKAPDADIQAKLKGYSGMVSILNAPVKHTILPNLRDLLIMTCRV
jgi:hypothetical protein